MHVDCSHFVTNISVDCTFDGILQHSRKKCKSVGKVVVCWGLPLFLYQLKGVNQHLKYATQVQQRPESSVVTLTLSLIHI